MSRPMSKNAKDVASTVAERVGVGPSAMVIGWQSMLADLLSRMQPYLRPGNIVTFRDVSANEKTTFQQLRNHVSLPTSTVGLYLPPSVRNQMMYSNQGKPIPEAARRMVDDGVALFCRQDTVDPLVNALLARPPHTAAIDVYAEGALLAGYTYGSPSECMADLQRVVSTHLTPPTPNAD